MGRYYTGIDTNVKRYGLERVRHIIEDRNWIPPRLKPETVKNIRDSYDNATPYERCMLFWNAGDIGMWALFAKPVMPTEKTINMTSLAAVMLEDMFPNAKLIKMVQDVRKEKYKKKR